MMAGMFSGEVKEVLTRGGQDFERSLEGVVDSPDKRLSAPDVS